MKGVRVIEGETPDQDETAAVAPAPSAEGAGIPPAPSDLYLQMKRETNKVLGEYLAEHIDKLTDGAEFISGRVKLALQQVGARALEINPIRSKDTSNALEYRLAEFYRQDAMDLFLAAGGDYASQLDVFSGTEALPITALVPEVSILRSIPSSFNKIFPYLAVLGMKPGLRDIPALAISAHIQSLGLVSEEDLKLDNFRTMVIPPIAKMLKVAQVYQVTQVKEVLLDLDRVVKSYETTWR